MNRKNYSLISSLNFRVIRHETLQAFRKAARDVQISQEQLDICQQLLINNHLDNQLYQLEAKSRQEELETRISQLEDRLLESDAKQLESNLLQEKIQCIHADVEFFGKISAPCFQRIFKCIGKSKSQLKQDLFVLSELQFKTNGYFVEFGATNGIDLSNTHLMENEFSWSGILVEPAKCWHSDLKKNRTAFISNKCVWNDSHSTVLFNEVDVPELSTIYTYSDCDLHTETRKQGKIYEVDTISLIDLLSMHQAPSEIDYLSIDTEGSEFEILSNFDFNKYTFHIITVEHNFTPMREEIFKLLTEKGYIRKHEELSQWDDWYVKSN